MKHHCFDGFIFIHINKTGGSSVAKALNIPLVHRTAQEKIKRMGSKNWHRKFSFTVVRNPWDKVVSHYHFRLERNRILLANPIEFKAWARLAYGQQDSLYRDAPKMFMPQLDWITDKDGNILVDEIIHF